MQRALLEYVEMNLNPLVFQTRFTFLLKIFQPHSRTDLHMMAPANPNFPKLGFCSE
jgi:hypothetical protein